MQFVFFRTSPITATTIAVDWKLLHLGNGECLLRGFTLAGHRATSFPSRASSYRHYKKQESHWLCSLVFKKSLLAGNSTGNLSLKMTCPILTDVLEWEKNKIFSSWVTTLKISMKIA